MPMRKLGRRRPPKAGRMETAITHQMTDTTIKTTIPIIILATVILTSCGESKKDRAQRESEALDRRTLIEYQRQENIQRQADRDQRAVETGVQVFDILTR